MTTESSSARRMREAGITPEQLQQAIINFGWDTLSGHFKMSLNTIRKVAEEWGGPARTEPEARGPSPERDHAAGEHRPRPGRAGEWQAACERCRTPGSAASDGRHTRRDRHAGI